jgi:hypothetical protein
MTDNEALCTAIVTGSTILGTAIRLSVRALRPVVALVVETIKAWTAALNDVSASVRLLVADIEELKQHVNLEKKIEQAVVAAVDEVSGVHEAADVDQVTDFVLAPSQGPQRQTPRGGYAIQKRPRTRGA